MIHVFHAGLNADAESGVGAKGIMQIMPKTFKEIKYKNPSVKGSLKQAKWNITVGIVVGSIFIGLGISVGLVMGMKLN